MPFLRFFRDRRGYESTYLLHNARRRGDASSQLLYWFRTPPHIKIGRAAFDEDAIRLLEDQHPDVEFDWDRILTARPPAAPETRDPREPRGRRPERRREPRVVEARQPRPVLAEAPRPSDVTREPLKDVEPPSPDVAAPVEPKTPVLLPPPAAEPIAAPAVEDPPARRFVRVFDAPAPPAEHRAVDPAVVERLVGAEQLTVLRARYAEILARISARGGDPARVEALREQAERVNPDAWVTEADVTAGLATLEATLADLHRIVGRRRRRRRRRSGGQRPVAASVDASTLLVAPLSVDDQHDDEEGEDEPDGPDE